MTGGRMIEPYYETELGKLYHGDCLEVLPQLESVDLILTDPPYGINANKMTLGKGKKEFPRGCNWDNELPDISILLEYCEWYCIFGGNYFAHQLPVNNHILVWWKGNDNRSFSECEMAWTNTGKQVRLFRHHWSGEIKTHPTQKPLAVMVWCIQQFPMTNSILDPYLGSGTTAIACERLNRRWIGIEISKEYCDIAVDRIKKEMAQYKFIF